MGEDDGFSQPHPSAYSQQQSEGFSGSCWGRFTGKTLAWPPWVWGLVWGLSPPGRAGSLEGASSPSQPLVGHFRKQREDLEEGTL